MEEFREIFLGLLEKVEGRVASSRAGGFSSVMRREL
jgi:hypothetical protein